MGRRRERRVRAGWEVADLASVEHRRVPTNRAATAAVRRRGSRRRRGCCVGNWTCSKMDKIEGFFGVKVRVEFIAVGGGARDYTIFLFCHLVGSTMKCIWWFRFFFYFSFVITSLTAVDIFCAH